MRRTTDHRSSKRVFETLPPIMQVMKDLAGDRQTVNLSQGIPFFGPPMDSLEKAFSAKNELSEYGPDGGDLELRKAISRKLSKNNGVKADAETEIMVTSGANLGFFNTAAAICDIGDEVILMDPFYFNHKMALDILGIRSKHVQTDPNHIPDLSTVERSIGPRTRAIVMVSPNNPTGMVYPEEIVKGLARICSDKDIFLISDETYEGFEYGMDHICPASFEERGNVISLFSLSKNYAISGWRIGYMVHPKDLHDGLLKVQDTTVICPSRMSQRVAYHCITDHPEHVKQFIPQLDRSRKMVIDWSKDHDKILDCPSPNGAYYAFFRLLEKGVVEDSMQLVKRILDRTGIMVAPGTPFGRDTPPHFRVAYGNLTENELRSALDVLSIFFQRISPR